MALERPHVELLHRSTLSYPHDRGKAYYLVPRSATGLPTTDDDEVPFLRRTRNMKLLHCSSMPSTEAWLISRPAMSSRPHDVDRQKEVSILQETVKARICCS